MAFLASFLLQKRFEIGGVLKALFFVIIYSRLRNSLFHNQRLSTSYEEEEETLFKGAWILMG